MNAESERLRALLNRALVVAERPPPPPKKSRRGILKTLRAVATFLRSKRRAATMKLVYDNPDGTRSILDVPDDFAPADKLPVPVEPIRPIPKTTLTSQMEILSPKAPLHWGRVAVGYGLYAVAIWINVKNAGGVMALLDNPMAVLGIVAETGLFFLWTCVINGPGRASAAAVVLLLFGYALWNDLRMAAITAADLEMARAERSTTGTDRADEAVAKAKAAAITACGPGLAKSEGCKIAKANADKAETEAKTARAKIEATAKPEAVWFIKFVSWASFGWLRPTPDDFDMWGLLFRMVIPQLGGVLLAFARR